MTEQNLKEQADEELSPELNDQPVPEQAELNADAPVSEEDEDSVDYEGIIREDIAQLKSEFPELSELSEITQLNNPLRYAALRDLGLSPAEAYMATAPRHRQRDNRSHLTSAMPKAGVNRYGGMTKREMDRARELFADLSDSEIQALYKSVTG